MDLPGPITVYAPVGAAFDSMTEGHFQYLSSAEVRTRVCTRTFFLLPQLKVTVYCEPSGTQQTGGAPQEPHRPVHCSEYSALTLIMSLIVPSSHHGPCLQLGVYNMVSTTRIVTMAKQMLTVNVTESVSLWSCVPTVHSPQ